MAGLCWMPAPAGCVSDPDAGPWMARPDIPPTLLTHAHAHAHSHRLVHRQHPSAYKDDTAARGVVRRHPLTTQVEAAEKTIGFALQGSQRRGIQRNPMHACIMMSCCLPPS